jgi:hypothetical protein
VPVEARPRPGTSLDKGRCRGQWDPSIAGTDDDSVVAGCTHGVDSRGRRSSRLVSATPGPCHRPKVRVMFLTYINWAGWPRSRKGTSRAADRRSQERSKHCCQQEVHRLCVFNLPLSGERDGSTDGRANSIKGQKETRMWTTDSEHRPAAVENSLALMGLNKQYS